MRGHQHEVFIAVDHLPFFLRVGSPKQKHDTFLFIRYFPDDRIGENFPPLILVRSGAVCLYGECGIQQEYALLRPSIQVARRGNGFAQVIADLFEDVHQRWWNAHALANGEAETIRLARSMIGVLADDDDLYVVKVTAIKCLENIRSFRVDGLAFVLRFYEINEFAEVGLLKFVSEQRFPGRGNSYIHVMNLGLKLIIAGDRVKVFEAKGGKQIDFQLFERSLGNEAWNCKKLIFLNIW